MRNRQVWCFFVAVPYLDYLSNGADGNAQTDPAKRAVSDEAKGTEDQVQHSVSRNGVERWDRCGAVLID